MSATTIRVSLMAALGLAVCACGADTPKPHEWVLYRPATSTFYVKHDSGGEPTALQFGAAGDVPLWADFTGTGRRVPGLYRAGQWLISTHADAKVDLTLNFGGQAGDIPLAADLDGDGRADLVIFRAGEWLVRGTRNPAVSQIFRFGTAGDVPMLADFDGDGKTDLAVFRSGQWYVDTHRNGKADLTFSFGGVPNERALLADWGGGQIALVLFRDGEWFVSAQRDSKVSAQTVFGTKGDIPVAIWASK
jgi:hypothetical protein